MRSERPCNNISSMYCAMPIHGPMRSDGSGSAYSERYSSAIRRVHTFVGSAGGRPVIGRSWST